MKAQFTIRRDIQGLRLRELLQQVAPRFGQRYLFVVRNSLGRTPALDAFLSRLAPSLIERRLSSKWPGTELLDGEMAEIFEGELTHEAAAMIAESVDGLLSFLQPDRPEDLSLLRADGSPWLTSCAHEHDIYLELTNEEANQLRRLAPWLLDEE